MSYKFDALVSILNWLESGQAVTPQYIQEQLGISERTSFRYMQTLEGAGFPVYFDKKQGSYRFTDGYSLRKSNISASEKLALLLAKESLKTMNAGLELELQHIEEKLSSPQRDLPEHIIIDSDGFNTDIHETFMVLNNAIVTRNSVTFRYHAASTGKNSKRTVDPYYLYFNDGIWTMRGWCHSRTEMRAFALDRIEKLARTGKAFSLREVVPHAEYEGTFGRFVDGEPVEVKLIFEKLCVPYLLRKTRHPSQQTRELADGRLEMTFSVNGILGIRPWIYRWLPNVQVVAPTELWQLVQSELEESLRRQQSTVIA